MQSYFTRSIMKCINFIGQNIKMNPMKLFKYCLFLALVGLLCHCRENKKRRIVEEYYPGGTIKSEIEMVDTMQDGMAKYYGESGRLLSTVQYKNDKREGWVTNYNIENGKIATKAYFKNDTQDGPVYQYYREGMLFRLSKYVKGRVDSIITTYWPNGKIKSQNLYHLGEPAIGLKEYDKTGKLLKQPDIIVSEINQAALFNKVTLKFSLSNGNRNVEFYIDTLEDGKYFNPKTHELRNDEGVGSIEYSVYRGNTLIEKISIVAKVTTEYGNKLILHKNYNLAVIN